MKYLWLLAWVLFIAVGAFVGSIIPGNYVYITGFAVGCFSTIFLKLYDIEKEKEGK